MSYDHIFKLVIVGDSQVGKASFAHRFTDNVFNEGQKLTAGIDFKTKTIEVDGKKVKLQIWLCAEHNQFTTRNQASLDTGGETYYRGADGVILVFDITNSQSFENTSLLFSNIRQLAPKDVKTIVVGNKCDMIENRQVAKERGETIAKNHNSLYVETSSKSGTNVQKAFTDLVQSIIGVQQPAKSDQNQNTNKAKARTCNIL